MAEESSPAGNFERMYSLLLDSVLQTISDHRHRELSRTRATLDFSFNLGPMPATRASIEAMRRVQVTEEEAAGGLECPICLDNYEVGGEAREMPCKHRFHSGCIEKWLRRHGSCPICRFVMPAEEKRPKRRGGEAGRRGAHSGVSVGGSRGSGDRSEPMDVDRGSGASGRDRSQGADEADGAWDPMDVDGEFDDAWDLTGMVSDTGMWLRDV